MKTYQKPIMIALSLTGNEQLCGSCSENKLRDNAALNANLAWLVNDEDGVLTKREAEKLFSASESCATTSPLLEEYCKFTSAGISIAWS